MGTDIYMYWKGKTKEDKEKQATGFNIGHGDVGYLRASIGMTKENYVLRKVFPPEYWATEEKSALADKEGNMRFKFTPEGFAEMQKHCFAYILAVIGKVDVDVDSDDVLKAQKEMGEKVMAAFGNISKDDMEITEPHSIWDFPSGIVWINSLLQFYELGMEKEKEGKEPRIYISW